MCYTQRKKEVLHMKQVGKPLPRVDAFDKATGRAKYTDDLCDRSALVVRVLRSTVAHGIVKSIDTSLAEQIPGVPTAIMAAINNANNFFFMSKTSLFIRVLFSR